MYIYLYTYKDLNKLMAKDALLLCLFLSFLVLLSWLLLFFFFTTVSVCMSACVCDWFTVFICLTFFFF